MKKVYLVDYTRCSVSTCGRPCIEKCPFTISEKRRKQNQPRVEIPIRFKQSTGKIIILSELCIQCGICANVCPMKAIHVKNLLEEDTDAVPVHVYPGNGGEQGFRLYGLPKIMAGRITGLCGPNGIGKSTVLDILSGKRVPNFGRHEEEGKTTAPELDTDILHDHVKEHELRDHFEGLQQGTITVAYKRQVLRILFDEYSGITLSEALERESNASEGFMALVFDAFDMHSIGQRHLDECSGGELQRFAIAMILSTDADVYLIDEPCTFLDARKRIQLANLLGERATGSMHGGKPKAVLVVEHDLAILDYLSDAVHLFYGIPHQFGVITNVMTTKTGINAYLEGYVKSDNVQFRENEITFKRTVGGRRWDNARIFATYGLIKKSFPGFSLEVKPGTIYESEILGVVGENGLGKSTFARLLAGKITPDPGSDFPGLGVKVSYKPQYITRDHRGTVKEFIMERSQNYDFSEHMLKLLYRPLGVDRLFDKTIKELSGGELQRTFIVSCLAARAGLYVLDEPSAYLDVEERLHISSVIRSMTKQAHATTIAIEHDIQIADSLADRLLIFKGEPGKHGVSIGPLNKHEGMNTFLKLLDITFRRDPENGRARINKKDSQLDKAQRASNEYFYDFS
ncbi:ribosome biogenesis/translation initiation ATPase RLI [Candidatus Bathyarchaeota archaeon]|nr:ribosome biogenesis/translation initiation ATPase RLI [Candidatus Bathyarchaeota archaeon]